MSNLSWIENVIEDLTRFARTNDMPELASKLDATKEIAKAEIASKTHLQATTKIHS